MPHLETRSALASENFDEANRKLKEVRLEMNLLFKIFIRSHYICILDFSWKFYQHISDSF